jgi:hypothetical protein
MATERPGDTGVTETHERAREPVGRERRGPAVAGVPVPMRWGSVFAGAIVGLAVLVLINSLWFALGTDVGFIEDNLHWFRLVSAIIAFFVGGVIAGWMSGLGGAVTGMFQGVTVWGLVLIGTLALDVPESLEIFDQAAAPLGEWGTGTLWATFLSLAGGLVVAAIGGVFGGGLSGAVGPGARDEPL